MEPDDTIESFRSGPTLFAIEAFKTADDKADNLKV